MRSDNPVPAEMMSELLNDERVSPLCRLLISERHKVVQVDRNDGSSMNDVVVVASLNMCPS